jgi:hypothetical protein
VPYPGFMLTEKALGGSKGLIPQPIRVGLELHLSEARVSSVKERQRSHRKRKDLGFKEIPRVGKLGLA